MTLQYAILRATDPAYVGRGDQNAAGDLSADRKTPGRGSGRVAGGGAESVVLIGHTFLIEGGFHLQHGLLGRLEHCVEAAQDGHRQDDIAVSAADVNVAEDVVGDVPDEVGEAVELGSLHVVSNGIGYG
jgi:hypothetical protein